MNYKKLCKIGDAFHPEPATGFYLTRYSSDGRRTMAIDLCHNLSPAVNYKLTNREYYPLSEDTVLVEKQKYTGKGKPFGTMTEEDWRKTVELVKKACSTMGAVCDFEDDPKGLKIKIKEFSI